MDKKYCECGCGKEVKNRFIHGHNPANRGSFKKGQLSLFKGLIGKELLNKYPNRKNSGFKKGNLNPSTKLENKKRQSIRLKKEYKTGARKISGCFKMAHEGLLCGENHPNWKEKIKLNCIVCKQRFEVIPSRKKAEYCSKKCMYLSNERSKKISSALTGKKLDENHIKNISIAHIGQIPHNKGKTKENYIPLKNTSVKMSIHNKQKYLINPELHPNRIMARLAKEGKSHYKSKPQMELFKIIKLWYGDKVELEYPLKLEHSTIFGDVVVPSEHLWFEYDGERYHSTNEQKEKDNIRQKKIEYSGFKVFRFDKNSLKELKGNLMEDVNVRRILGW